MTQTPGLPFSGSPVVVAYLPVAPGPLNIMRPYYATYDRLYASPPSPTFRAFPLLCPPSVSRLQRMEQDTAPVRSFLLSLTA